MQTSDFDYELPPDLIAQVPLPRRDEARMLVLDRRSGRIEHRGVRDLVELLRPGDLLVVNDTRVFPARVFGSRRDTGGRVELLLIERVAGGGRRPRDGSRRSDGPDGGDRWEAFCRAGSRPPVGALLDLAEGHIRATVVEVAAGGRIVADLQAAGRLEEVLERFGVPPVPPYIKRERGGGDRRVGMDRERYQTVYARETGAVAAPTAGLHFTPELLQALENHGVRRTAVTLHVGPGTFRPVATERVEDHVMEAERYEIGAEAAASIAAARSGGGRIVAVGSTTVRTLETVAAERGAIVPCAGTSSLFIRPPHRFAAVDAMLTNFHLPRSTLLMMVGALAGRERVLDAYREAMDRRYRFYSYGDCMLIA